MDRTELEIIQADRVAKIVAGVIIAGVIGMFGYGLIGWIFG